MKGEAFGLEGLEVLLASYDGRGRVLGVAVEIGLGLLGDSPLCVVAGALLLEYHSALLVYLLRVAAYEMRVVMHDEQAGVHHGGAYQRDVVEHVDGLLHSGRCVHVASEGCAYALQPVEYAFPGEVLGSVEAHVLEEVRETVLVGKLLKRAHMGGEIELGAVLGLVVVTDIIGQSVVKLADPGFRVAGEFGQLLPIPENDCAQERSH